MKKWMASLVAGMLILGCAAPVFAEGTEGEIVPAQDLKPAQSDPIKVVQSQLPTLQVYYGDQQQQAVRSGYHWTVGKTQQEDSGTAYQAEAPHPLEVQAPLRAYFERQSKAEQIWLQFSASPNSLKVERWDSKQRVKKPYVRSVEEKLEDGILKLPAEGDFLYRVSAEWDEGTVNYLFEVGPAPDVAIYADKKLYREGTTNINLKLSNNTEGNISYSEEYGLHRYDSESQKWYVVPLINSFQVWTGVIVPEQTVSCPEPIKTIKPLEKGLYRMVKYAYGNGKTYPLFVEFEIGEPQDQLNLGNPERIQLSIDNGKSQTEVELTRRGRYQNRSPLAYVVGELAAFSPVPQGGQLIGAAESHCVRMKLLYEDGAVIELMLDPTISILKDGKYHPMVSFAYQGETYLAERSVYDHIYSCAIYAQRYQLAMPRQ